MRKINSSILLLLFRLIKRERRQEACQKDILGIENRYAIFEFDSSR